MCLQEMASLPASRTMKGNAPEFNLNGWKQSGNAMNLENTSSSLLTPRCYFCMFTWLQEQKIRVKMKCPLTFKLRRLCLSLLLAGFMQQVLGQESEHAPKVAVKLQMYSPLSLLAQPLFDDKDDIPYTPRFYTGEVEYGWSDRRAMLLSLGIRRLRSEGELLPSAYDSRTAFKLTLAYRSYPLAERQGAMSGLVLSPIVRYVYGKRDAYDGFEFGSITTTNAISAGFQAGWQFKWKDHLLLNFGLGPELTYQHRVIDNLYGDALTGLDYAGLVFWQQGNEYATTKKLGLAPDFSIALGWLF
jgi:hypothetical protein